MFKKPFYFQFHKSQNEIQKPELLPANLHVNSNLFSHFCGPCKIRTGTGHRLVCWIFGACLMAKTKGTFCWHCKMAGKV